ncbi:complex I NDUFA9 subunit family protein [Marinobacter fonticola]|uniref:complex I NDUFA9 subunit family protein n=1 Tax=Marinobacter fonticola TaxID=2603215 RepID=UPI0011E846AB|nr:complex I NDUFA9 subunit family protein [Marinobacter fonticola]
MDKSLAVVFGGTGYLGTHIVRQLQEAGYRVRIASRSPQARVPGDPEFQIEGCEADILDEASIANAIEGATAVINAVSLYVEQPPELTFDAVHVKGAVQLARCCKEAGIRTLVQISGLNADPQSRSPYISARGRGENQVRETFPNAIVLRPSALFGGGQGLVVTLKALTRLPLVPLFGKGETRLQPVHVNDVAKAAVQVLEDAEAPGQIYELGGPQVFSYRELVKVVMGQVHRHHRLISVPFPLWHLGARVLSWLPNPPLTRDQLILMESDNRVGPGARTFKMLNIAPVSVTETIIEAD